MGPTSYQAALRCSIIAAAATVATWWHAAPAGWTLIVKDRRWPRRVLYIDDALHDRADAPLKHKADVEHAMHLCELAGHGGHAFLELAVGLVGTRSKAAHDPRSEALSFLPDVVIEAEIVWQSSPPKQQRARTQLGPRACSLLRLDKGSLAYGAEAEQWPMLLFGTSTYANVCAS